MNTNTNTNQKRKTNADKVVNQSTLNSVDDLHAMLRHKRKLYSSIGSRLRKG